MEKEFNLETKERKKNYQTAIDKREGLYIIRRILGDEIHKLDVELNKYKHK